MSEAPILFLGDDFSKQRLPDLSGNIPESWDWQEVYLTMKMNDTHLKRTEKEILEEKGRKGEGKSLPFFSTGRIEPLFFPPHHVAREILVPQPGIESHPQQWRHGVLTAEPPTKPQASYF